MENNEKYEFIPVNSAIAERQVTDSILQCNEVTEKYGLSLTQQQASALAKTRMTSLKETGRIEFGNGITDKLIMAVCDSPYITQENYEETLHELISLFYNLKNDTWDRVSDNDLIDFIRTAFNGICRGSLDLLAGKSLQLARHIHGGGRFETFSMEEK